MTKQPLTSFDIYILAAELNNTLAGKTFNRITAGSNDISFEIDSMTLRLAIISGTPYLIEADNPSGGRPWLANIHGGYINEISQAGQDRLIEFKIAVFDRLGKRRDFSLFIEMFKNGNVLLIDGKNKIVTSFRRIDSIGKEYIINPPAGLNILDLSDEKPLTSADMAAIDDLNIFRHRAALPQTGAELLDLVRQIKGAPQPHIIIDKDQAIIGYSTYGPPFKAGLIGQPRDSLLAAVTDFARALTEAKPIRKIDYTRQIKRAEKKYEAMAAELEATGQFKMLRLYGELILAHLHELNKGQASVELINLYNDSGQKVLIELDPTLSPRQNADRYFDKARRLETSIPIVKQRMAKQLAEIAKLKALQTAPEEAIETGRAGRSAKTSERKKVPFRQFDMGNGWTAYAGKSAKNNDELTFGFAHKDDLWFHAWQAQGSHIILRAPKRGAIADKILLLKTASLAAYYSKAKASGKVPIIYTEVRYLKKVKKVPGKVIYTNVKELMVEPQSPQELLH
jgi:predicted ribosome quality control (RQC) complex YloA/Tae2 family protein